MGYHILDIMIRLFGMPESVSGALSYCYDYSGNSHLEDAASIILKYPNNQLHGVIHLNRHDTQKKERLEIIGSNGVLIMDNKSLQFKDRSGQILTENLIQDDQCKLKMFNHYIRNADSAHFSSHHFNHHANIVQLIEKLYQKIR